MIWNVYFGVLASDRAFVRNPCGVGQSASKPGCANRPNGSSFCSGARPCLSSSSLHTFCSCSSKDLFPIFAPLTAAGLGALVVLFLNTAAYSAEIFYGALQSIPKGDTEAADAYGLSGWPRFKRVIWPTMLRLAWPAYTNEAIFLFHATTLVFFTVSRMRNNAATRCITPVTLRTRPSTPSSPTPSLARYFILLTLIVISAFWLHQPSPQPASARQCTPPNCGVRPTLIR